MPSQALSFTRAISVRSRRAADFIRIVIPCFAVFVSVGCAINRQHPLPQNNETMLVPVPEYSPRLEAWRKAEAIAISNPSYVVVIGRGGSMAPLFPDGTVLILGKKPMEQLQAGMAVAYLNSKGRIVVHLLTKHTPSGWIVRGLANSHPDAERVNDQNLIGTVIKAYSTTTTTQLADYTKQLVL